MLLGLSAFVCSKLDRCSKPRKTVDCSLLHSTRRDLLGKVEEAVEWPCKGGCSA